MENGRHVGQFENALRGCIGRDWEYKIHGYHFRGPIRRISVVQKEKDEQHWLELEIFLEWVAGWEKGVWFLDNSPETNPYHDSDNGCFSVSFKVGELSFEEDIDANLHVSAPKIQYGIIHKSGESLKRDSLKKPEDVF